MGFDKSLRLLNYARAVAGNLQLYTELDHSFEIGDRVMICGGYYDNVKQLANPTNANLFNMSNYGVGGYKVIQSNQSNNTIVVEYDTNSGPLVYPYGVTSNIHGKPDNTVNPAYSNDTDPDNYVYISKLNVLSGKMKQGVIKNGIFGNDTTKFKSNNNEISHIVAKNFETNTCTITSKTEGNVNYIKKLRVQEDDSFIVLGQPYEIQNVVATANNDGYGYSKFEKFKAVTVTANNVDFSYYKVGFEIDNLTVNKGKIGSATFLKPDALKIDNINAVDCEVNAHTNKTLQSLISNPTKTKVFNGCKYSNYIFLKTTGVTLGASGAATFNVPYYTIARTNIADYYGSTIYIGGFKRNGQTIFAGYYAEIIGSSYTGGDMTSAELEIEFDLSNLDWNEVLANPSEFDFSNMIIALNSPDIDPLYFDMQKNNEIFGYINTRMSIGVGETNANNIVRASVLSDVRINKDTVIDTYNNDDTYISIFLNNVKQYWYDDVPNVRKLCKNALLYNNCDHPLSFDYVDCRISSGTYYDSTMVNCRVGDSPGRYTYITDIEITNTKIDNDVLWNKVIIGDYPYNDNGNIIYPSNIGDRKTAWITSRDNNEQGTNLNVVRSYITNPDYYYNLSKTTQQPGFDPKWAIYHTDLEVPGLNDFGGLDLDGGPIVITHEGRMTYSNPADPTGGVWEKNINSKTVPLWVDEVVTGDQLYDAIENKINNAGPVNDYFNTAHPYPITSNVRDPYNVKESFVFKDLNTVTLKPTVGVDANLSKLEVFQDIPVTSNSTPSPDIATNITDIRFDLVAVNSGIDNNDISNNATVTTGSGDKEIRFKLPATMKNYMNADAPYIPNCFLEIEYIIVEAENTITNTTESKILSTFNHIHNNTVTGLAKNIWDNGFETIYASLDKNFIIPMNVPIEMVAGHNYTIKIVAWFTWLYDWEDSPLTSNGHIYDGVERGHRSRHEFVINAECDGSTYFMLTDDDFFIVDENDENISWT